MKRRDFFKSLFGAAIVAAMPKDVFETVVNLPEKPISPDIDGFMEIPMHPNCRCIIQPVGKYIVIYTNKNKVLAHGSDFNLDYRQQYNQMPQSWEDFMNIEPIYVLGQKSATIEINIPELALELKEHWEEKLNAVIVADHIRILSEVYVSELSFSINGLDGGGSSYAKLVVSGPLIIEDI